MLPGDMEHVVYGSILWGTNEQTCTLLIGPCTTCHGLSRRTCVTGCYKSQPGVSPLSLVTVLTMGQRKKVTAVTFFRCPTVVLTLPRVIYECGCTGARYRWNTWWRLSLESWSFPPIYDCIWMLHIYKTILTLLSNDKTSPLLASFDDH